MVTFFDNYNYYSQNDTITYLNLTNRIAGFTALWDWFCS